MVFLHDLDIWAAKHFSAKIKPRRQGKPSNVDSYQQSRSRNCSSKKAESLETFQASLSLQKTWNRYQSPSKSKATSKDRGTRNYRLRTLLRWFWTTSKAKYLSQPRQPRLSTTAKRLSLLAKSQERLMMTRSHLMVYPLITRLEYSQSILVTHTTTLQESIPDLAAVVKAEKTSRS